MGPVEKKALRQKIKKRQRERLTVLMVLSLVEAGFSAMRISHFCGIGFKHIQYIVAHYGDKKDDIARAMRQTRYGRILVTHGHWPLWIPDVLDPPKVQSLHSQRWTPAMRERHGQIMAALWEKQRTDPNPTYKGVWTRV